MKPYLLMDIDGPLNPFGARWFQHNQHAEHGFGVFITAPDSAGNRSKVAYSTALGARLMALADRFDLIWASGWCDEANTVYGPKIGLSELPFIDFEGEYRTFAEISGRFCWKTFAVAQWMKDNGPRPFVWFDDDVAQRDAKELRDLLGVPVMVLRVSAATGLHDQHFEAMADFAERTGRTAP